MNKDMYSLITCLHGNEVKPLLALQCLGLPYLIGNPKAVELGTRFVDVDLNASFGRDGSDYESARAKTILHQLPKDKIVIDFHTYSTKTSEPFVIIRDLSMKSFASIFGLPIVHMAYNPKEGHSLLDHRQGVSIETGRHDEAQAFSTTSTMISRLKTHIPKKVPVFQVIGLIQDPGNYQDFQETNGFYPVLSNSLVEYKHWGFRANKIE